MDRTRIISAVEAEHSDSLESASMNGPIQLKGTILIVEDHDGIAETYTLILKARGYDVILSSNGDECIQKFDEFRRKNIENKDKFPFTVVVVDYHIPGKDGIEVIQHILSAAPHQRILIASSYPKDVIRRSARGMGTTVELLAKPFDLLDLADAIDGRRPADTLGFE